jgi:predicted MFS family arabinose efflux permease
VIFALGGLGGLLGAALAGRITRRVGVGPALVGGVLLAGVAELVIAVAGGPRVVATTMVVLGEASVQAGAVLYSVNTVSLRQAIVPRRLQGRVTATMRLIAGGVEPLGALMGGTLGDHYGLRSTVIIAGAGTLLAFLWVVVSPVRRLREQPPPDDG